MIENIGSEAILMVVAVVGVILYMVFGFLNAKSKNPDLKFDYNYIYATGFTIVSVAILYSEPVEVVTISMILQAFLVGYGGNGAVTKVFKISPTPGQSQNGGQ